MYFNFGYDKLVKRRSVGGNSMEQTFLTGIEIKKVRHLENILIPLDGKKRKHLILTGKNGSGKTSVLESLVSHFEYLVSDQYDTYEEAKRTYVFYENRINNAETITDLEKRKKYIHNEEKQLKWAEEKMNKWLTGVIANVTSTMTLREKYKKGNFIFAYYKATREFHVEEYKNIEKVELQDMYSIREKPGAKLTKYLVDLKAMQAFTKDTKKREKIDKWFGTFERILKVIFEDDNLELKFNDETFQFSIYETGRESFDFNTMSSGYAAVLDIINDLILRMEAQSGLRTNFDMEGIVLVDELETHLHLDMQRKILPILTELFSNIQFIITTHSPFVLSSLDNAVIYDLQNETLVQSGLNNLPYEGIVEGYFKADVLSEELRKKFERYKVLVTKNKLSDEEFEEIDQLEYYLDEIPDYLAKELTAEYSRLKLEFSNRG